MWNTEILLLGQEKSTFPRTVRCWTRRWALSVFPAPLSPEITMHCTGRERICERTASPGNPVAPNRVRDAGSLPYLVWAVCDHGLVSQISHCENVRWVGTSLCSNIQLRKLKLEWINPIEFFVLCLFLFNV